MLERYLEKIGGGSDLTADEAGEAVRAMMTGQVPEEEMVRFLTALRDKGETVDEVIGAARTMRELSVKILQPQRGVEGEALRALPVEGATRAPVIDTCGTGGDAKGTFNFSTMAAFVVAGAGIPVAKHGNRSVSSKCGSADVLKACGVRIDPEPAVAERCLSEVGISFLFAPVYHPAMRNVAGARQKIGTRTLFNLLGPLTNPAGVKRQVMGVFSPRWLEPMAEVLKALGSERVLVVHGSDGLDEATLTGPTEIAELKRGVVSSWTLNPEDLGLKVCPPSILAGGTAETNANMLKGVLEGYIGPVRDAVLLNAALGILVAGDDDDLNRALRRATRSIDEGHALQKFKQLVEQTNTQNK